MSSEDPSDYETTPYLDSSDCTPYQGESKQLERGEGSQVYIYQQVGWKGDMQIFMCMLAEKEDMQIFMCMLAEREKGRYLCECWLKGRKVDIYVNVG